MHQSYDWDTYELFKEQLVQQIPKIEANILKLDKADFAADCIDELFRAFHNYKPISEYLNLTPFYTLVKKAETVLSALRNDNKKVVQDSIIDWLLDVKEQFNIWLEEIEQNQTELSETPKNLKAKIDISNSYVPIKDILKNQTILYIDSNPKRIQKIAPFLNKIVKNVISESDEENSNHLIETSTYTILIVNANELNFPYIELARQKNQNIANIAIFDQIDINEQKELVRHGISNTTTNPLNGTKIKESLIFLTKNYLVSRNIIIDNKKISNFIQTLEPLPNTIIQVLQICDDAEIPIKELIKIVKGDPVIAAVILKAANSPLYGSIELKTIDQAVSRLGKTAIKALVSSDIYKNINDIDLSPYNIDEEKFSQVSMDRLTLAIKWYSKVSISGLSTLSSTAVLGNIGQLLIAKELIDIGEVTYFKELCSTFDIKYAEGKILHTSTTTISSQILNYWQLSSNIVNTIAFTQNPNEASDDIKPLAIANNIIYKLIEFDGTIADEIPNDILMLMAQNNLDIAPLTDALEYVKANQK